VIRYAKIIWDKNTPKSLYFDDFYFSSRSGIQESLYNFIKHNNLKSRFSTLLDNQEFNIFETGFGSGLNFLLTLKVWQKYVNKQSKLNFISVEKYPLLKEDLSKIIKLFPEVFNQSFLDLYRIKSGLNIIHINKSITLYLVIDDVCNLNNYSDIFENKINAIYLDGFSPSKNSEMWQDYLFIYLARYSDTKTTFATFTSSSMVRKLLQKNGFIVKKDKGFGRKREMMFGCKDEN